MIELRLINGTWHATETGEREAMILELFGTNTLPTAYTDKSDADTVLAGIRRLNPGVEVIIMPSLSWDKVNS